MSGAFVDAGGKELTEWQTQDALTRKRIECEEESGAEGAEGCRGWDGELCCATKKCVGEGLWMEGQLPVALAALTQFKFRFVPCPTIKVTSCLSFDRDDSARSIGNLCSSFDFFLSPSSLLKQAQ